MANPKFSDEFKMNAIKLANNRGDRSLKDVAKELNISKSSLDAWLRNHREQLNQLSSDSRQWSGQEKLLAIAESHALTGEELSQW
ncbi:transposase, partial [Thorsellia kenyensis]